MKFICIICTPHFADACDWAHSSGPCAWLPNGSSRWHGHTLLAVCAVVPSQELFKFAPFHSCGHRHTPKGLLATANVPRPRVDFINIAAPPATWIGHICYPILDCCPQFVQQMVCYSRSNSHLGIRETRIFGAIYSIGVVCSLFMAGGHKSQNMYEAQKMSRCIWYFWHL